jgi:hypothetical protein
MSKEKYSFELRRVSNSTLEDRFTGTFHDARLRGDRLATRLGNVSLYAYNERLRRWEQLGTFLGHMRFVNKWGDMCIINSDYTGLVKAEKAKEEAK